jgi:hypothetical protein
MSESTGGPDAAEWIWWFNKDPRVTVTARICQACRADGTIPLYPN